MQLSQLVLSAAIAALLNAQVQVKGRFQDTVLAMQKSGHSVMSSGSEIYQPKAKVNNAVLQMEEMFENNQITKPYKFAESVDLKVDIKEDGSWMETRALDGTPIKIWRAVVGSDDALSLSLQFKEFHLPQGAELYIIGRESFMGAFTAEVNNKDDNSFATVPVAGDFLGLELVMPAEKPEVEKMMKDEIKLRVEKIAHGFRNFPKSFNDSGACNVDVACHPESEYVIECLYLYRRLTSYD